jgi:hypothetical protein
MMQDLKVLQKESAKLNRIIADPTLVREMQDVTR